MHLRSWVEVLWGFRCSQLWAVGSGHISCLHMLFVDFVNASCLHTLCLVTCCDPLSALVSAIALCTVPPPTCPCNVPTSKSARPPGCPLQNASRDFAGSLAALCPSDALRCAVDSAGSRALEALLIGPASTEAKKQLLGKLEGSWGKVALKAPGSFLVERAYAWGVSILWHLYALKVGLGSCWVLCARVFERTGAC